MHTINIYLPFITFYVIALCYGFCGDVNTSTTLNVPKLEVQLIDGQRLQNDVFYSLDNSFSSFPKFITPTGDTLIHARWKNQSDIFIKEQSGYYLVNQTSLNSLVTTKALINGSPGLMFNKNDDWSFQKSGASYDCQVMSRNGDILFYGNTETASGTETTSGIFLRKSNGKVYKIALEGENAPGGSVYSEFYPNARPAISANGKYFAFIADLKYWPNVGVYIGDISDSGIKISRIAHKGSPSPEGEEFDDFSGFYTSAVAVNDSGTVLFRARIKDDYSIRPPFYAWTENETKLVQGSAESNTAVFNNAGQLVLGYYHKITSGTIDERHTLFQNGDLTPDGEIINSFGNPTINEQNVIGFFCRVGSSIPNKDCLIRVSGTRTEVVVTEGDLAPGGGRFDSIGSDYSNPTDPLLCEVGHLVFQSEINDLNTIFMAAPNDVRRIIGPGDRVEGEIVNSVWLARPTVLSGTKPNDGPVNERGQVTFFASIGSPAKNAILRYSPNFPEPDVQTDAGNSIVDFSKIIISQSRVIDLVVKNVGTSELVINSVDVEGPAGEDYTIISVSTNNVPAGGNAVIKLLSEPRYLGQRLAYLKIITNDPDDSVVGLLLKSTSIPVPPATVKTLAATSVTFDSATLNGTVNAKGFDREVFFDWGSTKTLGISVFAQPSMVEGTVNTSVSAVLTGLLPHTSYFFRTRAVSLSEDTLGSVVAFTTLNRAPVAQVDDYTIVPGSTVTLPVLTNDSDADGDAMSLSTHTAITPSSAGKLTKVGNTFVFTAASSFTTASFSYTCKDAFKGTSASATVTLTAGTSSLNPPTITQESAGVSYPVAVTATGMWSVTESLPWVTVSPTTGEGDETVMVTLLPNASESDRRGIVMIGGDSHSVTQQGVVEPTLAMPDLVPPPEVVGGHSIMPPAAVGSLYSLRLEIKQGFPVSYKVTKLPPGLTIDGNTGVMSGRPTAGGTYDTTVQAVNAAGASEVVLKLRIVVAALHPGLVGTFHGFIDRQSSLNAGLGSRFELTTTTMGTFSGKWITGTTSVPFAKGQLNIDTSDANHPSATIVIPRTKSTPLTLELDFSAEDDALVGNLSDVAANSASVEAWRNPWSKTHPSPTYYKVRHSFLLEQGDTTSTLPQGFGFGSFDPVNPTTGAVTVKGQLADGSAYATKTFLGRKGELLIYQSLYARRGSVLGKIVLTPHDAPTADHALTGTLNWWKPSPLPNSKDLIYRSGFGPLTLDVQGADCPPINAGGLILGLPGNREQAVIEFSEGGLPGDPPTFSHEMTLTNPSAKGLTNKAILNENVPNGLKIAALDASKGGFRGEFTLTTGRKALFYGQLVKRTGIWGGYGYFLLPQIPEGGETAKTAARHSGKVVLVPQ